MFVFTEYRDAGVFDESQARLLYDVGIEPDLLRTPAEAAGFGGTHTLGELYASGDIDLQDIREFKRSRETTLKPH